MNFEKFRIEIYCNSPAIAIRFDDLSSFRRFWARDSDEFLKKYYIDDMPYDLCPSFDIIIFTLVH